MRWLVIVVPSRSHASPNLIVSTVSQFLLIHTPESRSPFRARRSPRHPGVPGHSEPRQDVEPSRGVGQMHTPDSGKTAEFPAYPVSCRLI